MKRLVDLARAAGDGDEAACERLVRVLWPNAYRVAWSILGDRGLAEDAAQGACATICLKMTKLANAQAFPAWAYRIVVSQAHDLARSRSRRRLREVAGLDGVDRCAVSDDTTDRLDLEAAIGGLPEPLRLVLELHYFVGLSSREVGIALGLPAATVRFRLAVARRRLRPLLVESIGLHMSAEMNA